MQFKSGASLLVYLVLLGTLSVEVDANDTLLTLPQQVTEPVALHLNEHAIDWANMTKPDLLQVFVGWDELCCDDRTPIAGQYAFEDHALTFTPAFGFVTGQAYVARVRIPGMDEKTVEFTVPASTPVIPARVVGTYPSGDILPDNVLRFYIHFSVPMSPHVAFDYIKLLDAEGIADEAAFMKFKQELWNEDRTRLTVLIDPGRIKRDVATNRELGPALIPGQQYTLSVDAGWPSADGASALPAFNRTFSVSDGLRERPDMRLWHSTSPCFGTTEALELSFDRPFDRHRLRNAITVKTEQGQAVRGAAHVGKNENSWRFVPSAPWDARELRIFIDATLEDVAGNNFYDLLDQVVRTQNTLPSLTTMTVSLGHCGRSVTHADP